ncbi:hypothetical protein [Colwellia sp. TT2012]|uniref:hypothetical protein n=1 Tax=Colwellia sp. TT2012 TaxID=1720342 RepID=UPI0009EB3C0C|nr:hypothetical protein [Colwellia sp. TT2012]
MATARKQQISLVDTPYYHCIYCCVRQEFLCGEDKLTGKNYQHRQGGVAEKLHTLSGVLLSSTFILGKTFFVR